MSDRDLARLYDKTDELQTQVRKVADTSSMAVILALVSLVIGCTALALALLEVIG